MARVDPVVAWLLDGDAAVQFWTRHLLHEEPLPRLARLRARIAREGWGHALLSRRRRDGTWGGGLYMPKWTSTHYTLLELRDLGISPTSPPCRASTKHLLEQGLARARDGGVAYWPSGHSDDCVTAMVLAIAAYFCIDDDRVDKLVDQLLAVEYPKGGWNCRRRAGDQTASIHTTLSVIESFDEVIRSRRPYRHREILAANKRARESLLGRRLFLSRRTRRPIDPKLVAFAFPPRWRFDVLRALFAFARARVPWDERMRDAFEVVRARQRPDGRWNAGSEHPGTVHLHLEKARAPGRWNTLRALFVLHRYSDSVI